MKLYTLMTMLFFHFVIASASDEITEMRFDWRGGYSPYEYIRIEIDKNGNGYCEYATFHDTVSSTFQYDEVSLRSLKEKLNSLHNSKLDSIAEMICSDCGVTTLSYKLGKSMFTIERRLATEREFQDITTEFYKISAGEEYLHDLIEFLMSSDRTLPDYWHFTEKIAGREIYNPSRFRPFLEEIAGDRSIRPEIRILASDCLPPEWNWKQYGLKMELMISKTRFRVGESIELTTKITNLKSGVDSLGTALMTLGFNLHCDHGKSVRCSYNLDKWRLIEEQAEKYIDYILKPEETITIRNAVLQDIVNFQEGKHIFSLSFIYDTIFDGDHAVYEHIRSNEVEFEIY